MSQVEDFLLPVKRFRNFEKTPTCRVGKERNERCVFYDTGRFGSVEICRYSNEALLRSEISGFTLPGYECPLWRE